MQDEDELSKRATELCVRHVTSVVREPIHVRMLSRGSAWDPLALRTAFRQRMSVWRRYGRFEVIADARGRIVGYVDHDKYSPCGLDELSEREARAIAARERLVPRSARFVDLRADERVAGRRTWRATFAVGAVAAEDEHGFLEVEINPTRGAVIAVRPRRTAP